MQKYATAPASNLIAVVDIRVKVGGPEKNNGRCAFNGPAGTFFKGQSVFFSYKLKCPLAGKDPDEVPDVTMGDVFVGYPIGKTKVRLSGCA